MKRSFLLKTLSEYQVDPAPEDLRIMDATQPSADKLIVKGIFRPESVPRYIQLNTSRLTVTLMVQIPGRATACFHCGDDDHHSVRCHMLERQKIQREIDERREDERLERERREALERQLEEEEEIRQRTRRTYASTLKDKETPRDELGWQQVQHKKE